MEREEEEGSGGDEGSEPTELALIVGRELAQFYEENPGFDPYKQVELVEVPKWHEDFGGWAQARLINAGRQNETINNLLSSTLPKASNWLQSIPDMEKHPILGRLNNNIEEMVVALPFIGSAIKLETGALVATAADPAPGDELVVGITIVVTVLGGLVIYQFSKGANSHQPGRPGYKPLPYIESYKNIGPPAPQKNSNGPDYRDELVKAAEAVGNYIKDAPLINKILGFFAAYALIDNSIKGDNEEMLNNSTPSQETINDPSGSLTPTSTPTSAPTSTPTNSTTLKNEDMEK